MNLHGIDPLDLAAFLWPDVTFYTEQRQIIASVWNNDETVVPAGHMLGKDFVTGFIVLAFFLTRTPCRIVTTSVDAKQLEGVLWGEIKRFIQTSRYPLTVEKGGPLIVNHLHIRKVLDANSGEPEALSYLIGRVAAKGEGLSGHHIAQTGDGIPRTLGVVDEASGVDQDSFAKLPEWTHRTLIIGNPYPCNNYFKWACTGSPDKSDRGGDIPRDGTADGYHRKVIRIRAEDSPNVRYALVRRSQGMDIDYQRVILPGVLPYADYLKRRRTWDAVKQAIGMDAIFYEGSETLMYPPLWLDASEERAYWLKKNNPYRQAIAIGVDTGQGRANTAFTAVDRLGIIAKYSSKTPDTSVIAGNLKAFAMRYRVPAERIGFDSGGGGYQIACEMRAQGWNVQTVGFGDSIKFIPRRGRVSLGDRQRVADDRYVYINKRGLMYGTLRNLVDPTAGENIIDNTPTVFAIPPWWPEYRSQLAPIPLRYDGHGRMVLPPKTRGKVAGSRLAFGGQGTSGSQGGNSGEKSMEELIGHSPDEADSLVLAIHIMLQHIAGRRVLCGPAF